MEQPMKKFQSEQKATGKKSDKKIDKEIIKKYNKDYYTKNKAKILEDVNKEKRCEICDCTTSKSNWSKHVKTKLHMMNMKIKDQEDMIKQLELN